jgi:hypothetical protein
VQRAAGNRATAALVRGLSPHAASLPDIARAAIAAPLGTLVARAGVPSPHEAPDGYRSIAAQRPRGSLGSSLGLTLVKGSAAFTPPQWLPDAKPKRGPGGTVWQPSVASTTATDVEHESMYPSAGDHDRFADAFQVIDGRKWHHVLRITEDQSDKIKRGEQEHLDDAALAFRLTYGHLADAINEIAQLDLPAAPSRAAALTSLVDALAARVPAVLGTDPAKWPDILDRLLDATVDRDTNHWHDVTVLDGKHETRTGKIVWPLDLSSLRLGTASSRVVVL